MLKVVLNATFILLIRKISNAIEDVVSSHADALSGFSSCLSNVLANWVEGDSSIYC